jgi:hypothetical protein
MQRSKALLSGLATITCILLCQQSTELSLKLIKKASFVVTSDLFTNQFRAKTYVTTNFFLSIGYKW